MYNISLSNRLICNYYLAINTTNSSALKPSLAQNFKALPSDTFEIIPVCAIRHSGSTAGLPGYVSTFLTDRGMYTLVNANTYEETLSLIRELLKQEFEHITNTDNIKSIKDLEKNQVAKALGYLGLVATTEPEIHQLVILPLAELKTIAVLALAISEDRTSTVVPYLEHRQELVKLVQPILAKHFN